MTPLARWVLLATLFGHAISVPARMPAYEDACVLLCRAENAAANEDKVHVIPQRQFVEGRRGREADRLLGLCFDRKQHSTICRIVVKILLKHRRCDCETVIEKSKPSHRTYVSPALLEDLLRGYPAISRVFESRLRENVDNVYRSEPMAKLSKRYSNGQPTIQRKTSKDVDTGAIMETEVRHGRSASNSFESGNDVSASMETWCIAQCDIGHGGSACDCDILP